MRHLKHQRGLTLVELLVAIVIGGVLLVEFGSHPQKPVRP